MPPILRSDSPASGSLERKDTRRSFALAVLVHVLLVVVLIFGLNWQTENPGPVQVELWMNGDDPQAAPTPAKPEPEP
ncbi:MAG: protein TolA, partial [Bordetella trematum]